MLILGIKLEKVWKQAKCQWCYCLDLITASRPKDGSESACTSKANPRGLLAFAGLPIPLLYFWRWVVFLFCFLYYCTANFWWKTPHPLLTVWSEGRDVRILLALGFMWFFNNSSIWFTCLVNCICEKTLSPDPAKLRIMIWSVRPVKDTIQYEEWIKILRCL